MALVPSDKLPVSFNNAFERLRATINAEDARIFASTTMQDVWNAARRIERQLEEKRSLRNFNRIQKFLAGIEQYSKIVEVFCNQTPYLPFIWAPIKLFLEISQANLSALDKLIDAYSMIGEAMPRFDKLSAAFKDDQDIQQVLGQFYEDILEFHRRAYKFFRRRAWKIVFESLWKTFDSRFEFILENLKKHRDLIDQEVNAANIVEAKAWKIKQLEEVRRQHVERAEDLDRMERDRLARQIREAAAWLGANEEQECTLKRLLRADDGMFSHWSLATPTILSWIEQGLDNMFLWLNGKPGAGKSVICSKIIEHIQEKTEMAVLFYFCHHSQTSKELISEVLKSFATQLLTANPGLAPYILDTFVYNGRKPTKKILVEILERLIASSGPIRFVVDGLDEWSRIDQEDLIKDLFRIRGPSPGACKILLSSRKSAHLTMLLQSEPTFRLEDYVEDISSNIASFVHESLERLRHIFGPELIHELENEILKRADGMFLWVRLILDTLDDLYFESDVREAIKTLPNGLDAVYERILSRICGNGRDPNQRRSVRILQWMVVAQRPLRQAELENGIMLDGQVTQITQATRARGNVLSLCYPLIKIDEDPHGYVNFCHFTAQDFLQHSNTFAALQPAQAHVTVSLSCVLYLASSLKLVDPSVSERDIRDQVIQGWHELLLYACDHWLDHLEALAKNPTRLSADQYAVSRLQRGLESLSHIHTELAVSKGWACEQQTNTLLSPRDDIWGSLGVSPSVCRLLNLGLMSRDQVSSVANLRPDHNIPSDGNRDTTLFTSVRARYTSITEDILNLGNPADPLIREFNLSHSSASYHCSFWGCPYASQGFSSVELRQQHEQNHTQQFQCSNSICGSWKFSSEVALREHTAIYHDDPDGPSLQHLDELRAQTAGSLGDGASSVPSSPPESVFSVISSKTSFSQHAADGSLWAAAELVTLLTNDTVLHPLYRIALDKDTIGADRFIRNFRRLLGIYSQELKDEAREDQQKAAVRLIRVRAGYVSTMIERKFNPGDSMRGELSSLVSQTPEEGRRQLLERFLVRSSRSNEPKNLQSASSKFTQPDPVEIDSESVEETDDHLGLEDGRDQLDLPNLKKVEEFLVSGKAFQNLRANFQLFVERKKLSAPVNGGKIPLLTQLRFSALHAQFTKPLAEYLLKDKVDINSIEMQLTMLGDHKAIAKPWVIVRCDQTAARLVKSFFTQPHVRTEFQPSSPSPICPHFDVSVDDRQGELSGESVTTDIYMDIPIRKRKVSEAPCTGQDFVPLWLKLYSKSTLSRVLNWWDRRLEPALDKGKKRIRWTCDCGKTLWDDFEELRPGAAEELRRSLNSHRSSCNAQDTNSAQEPPAVHTEGEIRVPATGVAVSGSQSSVVQGTANDPIVASNRTSVPCSSQGSPQSTHKKYVLLCLSKTGDALRLYQLNVQDIKNDVQLFQMLKAAYTAHRGALTRFLLPRKIKSVKFTKFERHPHERVVILSSDKDEILPDRTNPDACHVSHSAKCDTAYDLYPVPPDVRPYIGRNGLEHLLNYPHEAEELGNNLPLQNVWLKRFPKKEKTKLTACPPLQYGLGWGIEFEEAWHVGWLIKSIICLFVVAATVFLICWWRLRGDIQGAASVSALLISYSVLLITSFSAVSIA